MDTEKYCSNLENLDKTQAIRAIHEAYLQLKAIKAYEHIKSDNWFDNEPILRNLEKCLESAGHIGFN